MINKDDIKQVMQWSEEHGEYCSKKWNVFFEFLEYDPEVQTFYVKDLQASGNYLQFNHLHELEKKIQVNLGDRYKVGIIYEDFSAYQTDN